MLKHPERIEIPAPPQIKPKIWRSLLPGLGVSVACLAILFHLVDGRAVLRALRLADYRLVLAGWVMSTLWLVVRAAFWRTLLQEKAAYRQVFFTINQGYLLNNLLPLRLGEIGRAFLLKQKAGLEFWEILPTIFLERALDVIVAVVLFLSAIPFIMAARWAVQAALTTGTIVVVGFACLFLLARRRRQVEAFLDSLGRRRSRVGRLAQPMIRAFLNGLAALNDNRCFFKAVGLCLLNWLMGIFSYFLYLKAFFPAPSLLWAVFGSSASALGMAVPSSPGALGVYEAATVWASSFFVEDASRTMAFALCVHASNFLITGAIGGFALFKEGENLLSLYRRARSLK